MCSTIDSFRVTQALNDKKPEGSNKLELGLWVILDPKQTANISLPLAGQLAKIRKPDGNIMECVIEDVQESFGVIGICFKYLDSTSIPRLSEIEWHLL
jgi:hypothetical protein